MTSLCLSVFTLWVLFNHGVVAKKEPCKPSDGESLRKFAWMSSIKDRVENHKNWKLFDHDTCGETVDDRIIGGVAASLGQYPWLAAIGYKNKAIYGGPVTFSCGGALINSCWVLSAAHCVTSLPPGFYVDQVRLGEYDLDKNTDCDDDECAASTQDFSPSRIMYNKDFNSPNLRNDISLIKLSKPAEFNKWVSPICLPKGNLLTKDLIGHIAEVAGWGISNIQTGETSKVLQTVKLPVVNNRRCRRIFSSFANIGDSQLCVGGKIGRDSCNGDSGGPLMKVDVADGDTPKYYVFGLVSFGVAKCGGKPVPAVYTKVSKYMEWILDHVSEC